MAFQAKLPSQCVEVTCYGCEKAVKSELQNFFLIKFLKFLAVSFG